MQLELRRAARTRTFALPRTLIDARWWPLAATLATGSAAFAVYLTTLAPTVMWYDMGEFATTSATLGIAHNTGYPLLILLGKLFTFIPAGDTAYRVNLMSAVFTAAAIAVTFALIRDLTDDLIASATGALTLAFAPTVWANATWATSYGLNLFFTALIVRQMIRWQDEHQRKDLIIAALAFGLALCNHRLIVLVAPPSLLLLAASWRRLDRRTAILAAAAFLIGLSVYVYLPIRGEQDPVLSWARPANWHTYLSMFINGQTPHEYWRLDVIERLHVLWAYPTFDLTRPGLALAAFGGAVLAWRRPLIATALIVLAVCDAAVVLTYSIHNVYNYLTPGYFALAVGIGAGAAGARRFVADALARGAQPWLGGAALALLLLTLPATLLIRNQSHVDRSDDYSAYDFATTTLEHMPSGAVVMTDSWTASPLWYVQLVEGERRDVLVSPIFSVPGEDPAAFAQTQMDAGRAVFAAEGLRGPIALLRESYTLQPVLLDGIETMLTDVLPKPEYRDDLVPKGSLYRVLEERPDTVVASVPAGAERDVAFAQGARLSGFAAESASVARGSVVRLDYYWRADTPLHEGLSAVTVFATADGAIANNDGWPAWWHSRVIGEGVLEPEAWPAGATIKESYYLLVPREIDAGRYDVRIAVLDTLGGAGAPRAAFTTIGALVVE